VANLAIFQSALAALDSLAVAPGFVVANPFGHVTAVSGWATNASRNGSATATIANSSVFGAANFTRLTNVSGFVPADWHDFIPALLLRNISTNGFRYVSANRIVHHPAALFVFGSTNSIELGLAFAPGALLDRARTGAWNFAVFKNGLALDPFELHLNLALSR
jgi:hypothetical protein